jgi:RNA polymerase-binding transcription factor DksA
MRTRDIVKLRNRLQARLQFLRARFEEIQRTLREPEDDDLAEQAADLDDDHVLERLAQASQDEMALIRAALERIDEGTYGKCKTCGKPIAASRLRALREASTCLSCAEIAA